VESFPDISGSWSVSMTAMPGSTTGADGSCTFEPIVLDLAGEEFMSGVLYYIDGDTIRLQGSWTAMR
jgi:hypothetical protein